MQRNRRHSVLGSVGEAGHTQKRKKIMFSKTLHIRLTSVTRKERIPGEAGAEAGGGVTRADGQRGERGAWIQAHRRARGRLHLGVPVGEQ